MFKKSKNKKLNIAINGFGRIGRSAFKALHEKENINIVAVNDLADPKMLMHLLKYDSAYGIYDKKIKYKSGRITAGSKSFFALAEKDPQNLPWQSMEVDVVLECTGRFRTKDEASAHIKAGAKKVIISAPAKGEGDVKTIVLGVNEEKIKKSDSVISMASCTTNCLSPVVEVIRKNFGIKKAIMTTVHSYTADQNLVDAPHKDFRRARAATENIIPTTTGAALATTKTIPRLAGNFDGMAIRVPSLVGSLCDIVFVLNKKTDEKEINKAFEKAEKSAKLKGILKTTKEPIVSRDIVGESASAIVDLSLTKVIGGDLAKVVAWYDNEWGYSVRLADLVEYIYKKKLI